MHYCLHASAAQIAMRFGADAGADPWTGGEVSLGNYVPVIVHGGDRIRRIVPRQWGVPPPPKVQLVGGAPVLTVRNPESPFWIGTMRHREFRCLVPVTSFRIGKRGKHPEAGRPVQHWFTLPASPLFAFAGIWRDSEVPSFAILSCEANRLVGAQGAESMPLILHAEDYERWFADDWKQAQKLVAPFPSQLMSHAPR